MPGQNNEDVNQNRQQINFNQLQANLQIFTGEWEKIDGTPIRPKANIKRRERIDLNGLNVHAPDPNYEWSEERLSEKSEEIIKFFQQFPNALLFWSTATLEYIIGDNELISDPSGVLPYWQDDEKMQIWKNQKENHGQLFPSHITGDATSYTVAHFNNLTCLRMLLDRLSGEIDNMTVVSKIFAKAAAGGVYFLTGEKNAANWKGIWWDFELPELMRNEKVDMIIELDLLNPEKINAIIIKKGLSTAQKHGFELPDNFYALTDNDEFKGMFRLQFGDDGIKYSRIKINPFDPKCIPNIEIEFEKQISVSELKPKNAIFETTSMQTIKISQNNNNWRELL